MAAFFIFLLISVASCFETFKNLDGVGPTFYIRKTQLPEQHDMRALELQVTVPEGMYFALAWGLSHDDVNAVVFRGAKDGDAEGVYHDV